MDKSYLQSFEVKVAEQLVKLATEQHRLASDIYVVDELNEAWRGMAPYYMADAVPWVGTYPMVSVAWAGYLGMGAAAKWDEHWDTHSDYEMLYKSMVTPRGFDELDEYVTEDLLGMKPGGEEWLKLEDMMRSLSTAALTLLRREELEAQTPEAFHFYARVVKVMYVVCYSMELYRLGYRYHKVTAEFEKDSDTETH